MAPLMSELALRAFEQKIFEKYLPDYATDDIWDDQFAANYLDPIRSLIVARAQKWEAEIAKFRELQGQVDDQLRSLKITTWKSRMPGKFDEIFEAMRASSKSHLEAQRKFRELDRDGLQNYYWAEAGSLLRFINLETSIADRPYDTVERNGQDYYKSNSFIVDRVTAVVDMMELACLTHFAASSPPQPPGDLEVDHPGLHTNDYDNVRTEYPLLEQLEALVKTLRVLVKQEEDLFWQTRGLQVVRDSAHGLYELFSLHKFPHDVSYRSYDSDHERLLYPTTVFPASQKRMMDMAGVCGAVREITERMSAPHAAMFLQTLTYLILSAIVSGTRRSRFPAVAAFGYVQAAERGLGLSIIGEVVDEEFAGRLRASFQALNHSWNERDNDVRLAEAYKVAMDMLPDKPKVYVR
ncbi:hypothetical protein [Devosia enhydra]|nr:hypothetical protein [Devosia enhydra]